MVEGLMRASMLSNMMRKNQMEAPSVLSEFKGKLYRDKLDEELRALIDKPTGNPILEQDPGVETIPGNIIDYDPGEGYDQFIMDDDTEVNTGGKELDLPDTTKLMSSVWHETSPETAFMFGRASVDKTGLNVATEKDLALGQKGKGAIVEFDKEALKEDRGSYSSINKPGFMGESKELRLIGGSHSPHTIKSITVRPDASVDKRTMREIKRFYDKEEVLGDGSVVFVPKWRNKDKADEGYDQFFEAGEPKRQKSEGGSFSTYKEPDKIRFNRGGMGGAFIDIHGNIHDVTSDMGGGTNDHVGFLGLAFDELPKEMFGLNDNDVKALRELYEEGMATEESGIAFNKVMEGGAIQITAYNKYYSMGKGKNTLGIKTQKLSRGTVDKVMRFLDKADFLPDEIAVETVNDGKTRWMDLEEFMRSK